MVGGDKWTCYEKAATWLECFSHLTLELSQLPDQCGFGVSVGDYFSQLPSADGVVCDTDFVGDFFLGQSQIMPHVPQIFTKADASVMTDGALVCIKECLPFLPCDLSGVQFLQCLPVSFLGLLWE